MGLGAGGGLTHEEWLVQVVGTSRVRAFERDLEHCRLYAGAMKDAGGKDGCYKGRGIVSYSPQSRRFALGLRS